MLKDYLKKNIRKTDIACRLGGDEFLIICNYCNKENALCLANKLNNEIKMQIQNDNINYWEPSISIGIAEIDDTCSTSSEILNKADGAMYIAKNSGGNSAEIADKLSK